MIGTPVWRFSFPHLKIRFSLSRKRDMGWQKGIGWRLVSLEDPSDVPFILIFVDHSVKVGDPSALTTPPVNPSRWPVPSLGPPHSVGRPSVLYGDFWLKRVLTRSGSLFLNESGKRDRDGYTSGFGPEKKDICKETFFTFTEIPYIPI